MSHSVRAAAAGFALVLASTPATAAEWKHEFAPYLWGSAMEGAVGIGTVTADAEMSFSDILDDLEFGFMGMYRASRDREGAGWHPEGRHRRRPDRPRG